MKRYKVIVLNPDLEINGSNRAIRVGKFYFLKNVLKECCQLSHSFDHPTKYVIIDKFPIFNWYNPAFLKEGSKDGFKMKENTKIWRKLK